MEGEREASRGRRGYISRQLAALSNQDHRFLRSKNGIKKENRHICREAREKKKLYLAGLEKVKREQELEIAALREQVENLKRKVEHRQNSG